MSQDMSRDPSWSVRLRPLRIEAGEGALAILPELVAEESARRVMVVTDRGIQRAGHLERAVELLHREIEDLATAVFSEVEENPTESNVAAAAERARKFLPDLIVGLGGGSAMDCAKGLNFVYTNGGRMLDYWGFGKAKRPMLPSIGIPCSTGTGSEAQSFALISRDDDHVKMACGDEKARFRAVILDSDMASTQPKEVFALTALDAISHAVESFVSKSNNPISRQFSRAAWELLSGGVPKAAAGNSHKAELWLDLLTGAHLAGAAVETSMLGAAHALANPISSTCGLAHGAAVAIMLPVVVRWNAQGEAGDIYQGLLGTEHSGGSNGQLSSAESIARLVEKLRLSLGVPTALNAVGIVEEQLPALAAMASKQWTGRHNPRSLEVADALGLYRSAFEAQVAVSAAANPYATSSAVGDR